MESIVGEGSYWNIFQNYSFADGTNDRGGEMNGEI